MNEQGDLLVLNSNSERQEMRGAQGASQDTVPPGGDGEGGSPPGQGVQGHLPLLRTDIPQKLSLVIINPELPPSRTRGIDN